MLRALPPEVQRASLYRTRQCKPFQGNVHRVFKVFWEPLGDKDTARTYLLFSAECQVRYVGKALDSSLRTLATSSGFAAKFKEHIINTSRIGSRRYVCRLQRHFWLNFSRLPEDRDRWCRAAGNVSGLDANDSLILSNVAAVLTLLVQS